MTRARRVFLAAAAWGAAATLVALAFAPRPLPEASVAWLDRARDPRGAVAAWERAAAADPSRAPFRDVVRGLVAATRAETAMVLASGPDAPPSAYDRPISDYAAALDAFADAAFSRPARGPAREIAAAPVADAPVADAPVAALARRDAERAWLRLRELRGLQEEARQRRQEDPPPPDAAEPADTGEGGDETRVAAVTEALPESEVAGLLERLRGKQEEKRALRRGTRDPGAGGDW